MFTLVYNTAARKSLYLSIVSVSLSRVSAVLLSTARAVFSSKNCLLLFLYRYTHQSESPDEFGRQSQAYATHFRHFERWVYQFATANSSYCIIQRI